MGYSRKKHLIKIMRCPTSENIETTNPSKTLKTTSYENIELIDPINMMGLCTIGRESLLQTSKCKDIVDIVCEIENTFL